MLLDVFVRVVADSGGFSRYVTGFGASWSVRCPEFGVVSVRAVGPVGHAQSGEFVVSGTDEATLGVSPMSGVLRFCASAVGLGYTMSLRADGVSAVLVPVT